MALYNWPVLFFAGAPTDAVDEVQSVAIAGTPPTGGTFTLTHSGQTTAAIAFDADAAEVEAALQALSNIDAGDVLCSGTDLPGGTILVTFRRGLGGQNVDAMTGSAANLTGGANNTITIATPTAGIRGTFRGAQAGALLADTTNGKLYENTGDPYSPIWTEIEP